MSQLKKSAALLLLPFVATLISLTACTPEYTRQQSVDLAGQARLLDAVDIERSSQRVLSHQEPVCLLSASGGTESGAELLRTMQAGFSGYFVAVGVNGESIDYLRMIGTTPCPGASYLFYVQPIDAPSCDNAKQCGIGSQFAITVISAGDHALIDRVKFTIKNSFLPSVSSERERRQKAFEQLAIVLTGAQ